MSRELIHVSFRKDVPIRRVDSTSICICRHFLFSFERVIRRGGSLFSGLLRLSCTGIFYFQVYLAETSIYVNLQGDL
jgi:hypothetical protein